jgi:F-type H+-transporting ATPase subunit delta
LSNIAVTNRYAKALLDAAEVRDALDRVADDGRGLQALIRGSEELRGYLADPLIHPAKKASVLQSIFQGKVHEVTLSFLRVLCEKRRERSLADILGRFLEVLDERRGMVTARVRSSSGLSEEQQQRLAERLSGHSGKQVRLEVEVDEGLKAGFVARLGDTVYDGSLEAQLARLRRTLVAGS